MFTRHRQNVAILDTLQASLRDNAGSRPPLGRPVAWRLSFRGDTLVRAERVDGGKVAEWMERTDGSHVRYKNEGSRRSLRLSITRSEEVDSFDASIWRFDR